MANTQIPHDMATSAFELDQFTVTKNHGIARGIVVRSRSVVGQIGAGLQTIIGGNISILEKLCEQTREQAFERLLEHAAGMGANAVVGVRYDATELMRGVTEVLAYGTAVSVDPK